MESKNWQLISCYYAIYVYRKNEKDSFIRCPTITHVSEKINNLNFDDKIKYMEQRVTELNDEKNGDSVKTINEVEETYASVVSVEK